MLAYCEIMTSKGNDMSAQSDGARNLHNTLDFIGLRAHATTVGLLQLCMELVKVGAIDLHAVERIKSAIHGEITASHSRRHDRDEFARVLKQRLDAIFPHDGEGHLVNSIGTVREMQAVLEPHEVLTPQERKDRQR